MPVTSTELITSRTISYASGTPVGIREFHITDCPNEDDVWDEIFDGVNLPAKRTEWNTVSTGGTAGSASWMFPDFKLYSFDYELRRDPNVYAAWFVRVTYREIGNDPVNQIYLPGEVGYVNLRSTYEATFINAWRQWDNDSAFLADLNLTTYQPGEAGGQVRTPKQTPGSANSDIGGRKIDIAGNPASTIVYKQRIVVDLVAPSRINAEWLRDFMGTRNFLPYLGVAEGALLFAGADASVISPGKWQHTYNFEADYWYHLVQQPARTPHGDIILSLGSSQANLVSWVQPFPRAMNFNDIEPNGYLSGL